MLQGRSHILRVLPLELLERLTESSQAILDCSEPNEGFYVKCGYKRAGLEMAHYYDTPSKSTGGESKQREGAPKV